jgi:hypothetical protein
MTKDAIWFEIPNPPGKKRAPGWGRRCALDEDGDFWVPAALGGSETAVFMCAAFDGEPVMRESGHIYVRDRWLSREHPELADLLGRMRANAEASRT